MINLHTNLKGNVQFEADGPWNDPVLNPMGYQTCKVDSSHE